MRIFKLQCIFTTELNFTTIGIRGHKLIDVLNRDFMKFGREFDPYDLFEWPGCGKHESLTFSGAEVNEDGIRVINADSIKMHA